MKVADFDQAVAYFRRATGDSPDNPNYRIALQRAMLAASRAHFDKAREFEEKDQIEAARGEYQMASEYDPSNRQAAAKVTTVVLLNTPMTPLRVGGGPYNVPVSITNVSRLSTVTLTVTFDPALLRPRAVTEGGFMRSGGSNATFTNQVGQGRIDVTIVRSTDSTGATGTGLLFSVLFDAIAPGTAGLGISGAATGPGGTPMGLQFRSAAVTVQP